MSEFNAEFWQEIKEKYPKGWNLFKNFIRMENCLTKLNNKLKVGVWFNDKYNYRNICYCDIEKFFDAQGIIILIIYCDYDEAKNYQRFSFDIINKQTNNLLSDKNIYYDTHHESKLEAVKKAFEILNNQLENEE